MSSPLDRFKRPRQPPKPWLTAEAANALDAESIAAALGLSIEQQGRHCECTETGIRGTDKGGRLVWCDKAGAGIGDTCALAQYITGLPFREALELLLGETAPRTAVARPTVPRHLRMPRGTEADRTAGRAYLVGRGIAPPAMDAAEACGMLRYVAGAVLFVGYDGRQPKSATRRGYLAGDPMPKRDLAGTDKSFPAILPGDPATVWIVEGGADALAVLSLYLPAPTVIVSGGAGCRSFLGMQHVRARLGRAHTVMVALERETDADTQARTDAQHHAQAALIRAWCADVRMWTPPAGRKDLADTLEK